MGNRIFIVKLMLNNSVMTALAYLFRNQQNKHISFHLFTFVHFYIYLFTSNLNLIYNIK